MAAIKADGYGHGILRVASALHDADAFAVATIDEAVSLRQHGIDTPICLLEGIRNSDELELASTHKLTILLHSQFQLDLLERHDCGAGVRVWIKIDSGMHRLGFSPDQALAVRAQIRQIAGIEFCGWMTHLANADDLADEGTIRQLECFGKTLKDQEGQRAVANSAGILGWPGTHSDWVRPGLMLYGASPMIGGRAEEHRLQPVMTLAAELIAINRIKQGECVGYGGSWCAPEEMQIGVVGIGYGDGYPRHAPSGTPVLLNGTVAPLVGRVSMDMITIDLRQHPGAKIGDQAILWGDGLAVEAIAQAANTIPYELFCKVTARVPVDIR